MSNKTPQWNLSVFGQTESISFGNGLLNISCFYRTGSKDNPIPENEKYQFSINGARSVKKFSTMEECKRVAINSAGNKLALAVLEMKQFAKSQENPSQENPSKS